jgi:hypothetical protein
LADWRRKTQGNGVVEPNEYDGGENCVGGRTFEDGFVGPEAF